MSGMTNLNSLQPECSFRGKLRAAELEWLQQRHIPLPEPETQFDPAPAWPLWLCSVVVVAALAFACVVWP